MAGVWGCPPEFSLYPPSLQEGGQGDGPSPNRSAAPASRESRGVQPHWQEAWRMCLHNLLLFTFPLPYRKGARGMVRATRLPHRPTPRNDRSGAAGVQRAQPFGRGLGVSPRVLIYPPSLQEGGRGMVQAPIEAQPPQAGSPEGCNPTGRRHGGCASITYFSLLSPFLPGRGLGGWSEPQIAASLAAPRNDRSGAPGVQRAQPFGRGLGVSPRDLSFTPLPYRKGARGMVPN